MGRAGTSVDVVVPTSPGGPGVTEVLEVVRGLGGFRVELAGRAEYRLTRVFRPTWAVVLGCVTAPTLVGLGFLLVRRTETCTLAAESGPGGPAVRLRGVVPPSVVEQVRRAVAGSGPVAGSAGAPGTRAVAGSAGALGTGSAARLDAAGGGPKRGFREAPALPTLHAGPSPAAGTQLRTRLRDTPTVDRVPRIVLDDGLDVVIATLLLIGRDPAPDPAMDPAESAADCVRVDDPGRSVSKTHVAVGADADGVWVADRHSTNGTSVDGVECPPGERVRVTPGATVRFGDRTFVVPLPLAGDGPAPATAEPTVYRRSGC